MPLAMPVVWSDRHRMHNPGGEVWVGVRIPAAEVPERADRIREALAAAGSAGSNPENSDGSGKMYGTTRSCPGSVVSSAASHSSQAVAR